MVILCVKSHGKSVQDDQQTEMAEMRRMIEDLTRAVQALQGQGRAGARMEIPEGRRNPRIDTPEGDLRDNKFEDMENPFHDAAGDRSNLNRGELEERLVRVLDLNGGEKGNTSLGSPHRKVCFTEFDGDDIELPDPVYDDYDDEEEINLLPVEEESLVLQWGMAAAKVEEDWRQSIISPTQVLYREKVARFHKENEEVRDSDDEEAFVDHVKEIQKEVEEAMKAGNDNPKAQFDVVQDVLDVKEAKSWRGRRYWRFLVEWLGKNASASTWVDEGYQKKLDPDVYPDILKIFSPESRFSQPGGVDAGASQKYSSPKVSRISLLFPDFFFILFPYFIRLYFIS